jgi:hypothetical protein
MKTRSAFVPFTGLRDVKVVQNSRETQQNVGDIQGIRASYPFVESKSMERAKERLRAFLTLII